MIRNFWIFTTLAIMSAFTISCTEDINTWEDALNYTLSELEVNAYLNDSVSADTQNESEIKAVHWQQLTIVIDLKPTEVENSLTWITRALRNFQLISSANACVTRPPSHKFELELISNNHWNQAVAAGYPLNDIVSIEVNDHIMTNSSLFRVPDHESQLTLKFNIAPDNAGDHQFTLFYKIDDNAEQTIEFDPVTILLDE